MQLQASNKAFCKAEIEAEKAGYRIVEMPKDNDGLNEGNSVISPINNSYKVEGIKFGISFR